MNSFFHRCSLITYYVLHTADIAMNKTQKFLYLAVYILVFITVLGPMTERKKYPITLKKLEVLLETWHTHIF